MSDLPLLLKYLHLLGDVIWIGSIIAVGVVLATSDVASDARAALARKLYRRLAAPAFGLAFLSGVALLLTDLDYYFVKTKFMHAKLTFALVVIALHHVLGAKAKRFERDPAATPKGAGTLTALLTVAAALTALFAVFKFF